MKYFFMKLVLFLLLTQFKFRLGKAQTCPAGQMSHSTQLGTAIGEAGSQAQRAGSLCVPCTEGKDFSKSPAAFCTEGHFWVNTKNCVCLPCAPGRYKEKRDYSATTNRNPQSESCKNCPTGKYQDQYAQANCKICDGILQVRTEVSCEQCFRGQFTAQNRCIKCPPGKFQDYHPALDCQSCAPGFYNDQTGQTACKECPQHKVVTVDSVQCVCNSGQFKNATNQCQECPTGQYKIALFPENSCTNNGCPTGKYAVCNTTETLGFPNNIDPGCNAEHPYRLEHTAGSEFCYAQSNGNTGIGSVCKCSCEGCGASQTQCANPKPCLEHCNKKQALTCTNCPAGKYAGSKNSLDCKECEMGKYGDSVGQSACNNCQLGKYQNEKGKIRCKGEMCGAGKYASTYDSTVEFTCLDCPPGKFADGLLHLPECITCTEGKFQNLFGQDSCKNCNEGLISNANFTACVTLVFDSNYFPGFAVAGPGLFSSGIGPAFYKPLFEAHNTCLESNTVTVTQLHDGSLAQFIVDSESINAVQTRTQCCNLTLICVNGVFDEETCKCECQAGFTGELCDACVEKHAAFNDTCQSCEGNFRKNTEGKCTLCKFGYLLKNDACDTCLENLDISEECRATTCQDLRVIGQAFHSRVLLAWDENNAHLLVDNAYMEREGTIPTHLRHTYVQLEPSGTLIYLNETHRHTVDAIPANIQNTSVLQENWWIWTILPGTATPQITNARNATLSSSFIPQKRAQKVPAEYTYMVVCSHYDSNRKYVLAPYTKHRYTGTDACVKIDSALLQKIPLAQPYTIDVTRSVKSVDTNGITNGTKENDRQCAQYCHGQSAWTFNMSSKQCTCFESKPYVNINSPSVKDIVSGGVVNQHQISPGCNAEHPYKLEYKPGGIPSQQLYCYKSPTGNTDEGAVCSCSCNNCNQNTEAGFCNNPKPCDMDFVTKDLTPSKIALLEEERVQQVTFAETPLVCCEICGANAEANYYLRDGFSCTCYKVNLTGTTGCLSLDDSVTDLQSKYLGKKRSARNNTACDRTQGCVEDGDYCIDLDQDAFQQDDEIQFGETSFCPRTEIEYVKLYEKTTDFRQQVVAADDCENNLSPATQWELSEKPIHNANGDRFQVFGDDPKSVFVERLIGSSTDAVVTPLQLTQTLDTTACEEKAGYAATLETWRNSVSFTVNECLGNENCPAQSKAISQQLLQLDSQVRDASTRCLRLQNLLNENKAIMLLKQCPEGRNPANNCKLNAAPVVPTPNPRIFTDSPTPAPTKLANQSFHRGCLYETLENQKITVERYTGSIELGIEISFNSSEDDAFDKCTKNLICSHFEKVRINNGDEYNFFSHPLFGQLTGDGQPEFASFQKASAGNTTTYFKKYVCFTVT